MKLTTVRLLVEDFPACHKFYSDVIGLKPRFGDGNGVYEEFDANGIVLALFNRGLMEEAIEVTGEIGEGAGDDPVVLTFEVEDVDKTVAELKTKHIAFISEAKDQPAWMLRVAHFRDPGGNLIEINAPLKK